MNTGWRQSKILEKVKRRVGLRKSVLLFLGICGTIPLVSGCWDRVEINDLAIVTAAAIEKKEDNQIELSIQVFIPKSLSSGGGQGGPGGGGGVPTTLVSPKKDPIFQMHCLSFKARFHAKFFGDNVKYLYSAKR